MDISACFSSGPSRTFIASLFFAMMGDNRAQCAPTVKTSLFNGCKSFLIFAVDIGARWNTMVLTMRRPRLDAEIKTRLPNRTKETLQQIAEDRHLELSDIVREALREYVAKRAIEKPEANAHAA
jgi:Ribbon-helix-helix protein, copG family